MLGGGGRRRPKSGQNPILTSMAAIIYGVCMEFSRKPVKQHIGWFYWLTRGGEGAAGGVRRGGGFGTQRVSAWVGFDFRYTNFVGRLGAGFYLHRVG